MNRLLLLLALLTPEPFVPATHGQDGTGVLLLAHGGRAAWNDAVMHVAAELDRDRPTEVAFGMATRRTIQRAVERLEARGVTRIVAVPLFVSSHSSVIRSTEYLLGLRADAPADLAVFARMDHGAHGGGHAGQGAAPTASHAGHHEPAGASDAAGASDPTSPVTHRVPIRMTEALNRHPLVADILVDRVKSVSRDPSREVVVLVAHGPVPDDDNARWLADMSALAEAMRGRTAHTRIEFQTVRDDAPEPIRGQAAQELRERIARITAAGDRALVVPLLLSFGGIEHGIRARLEGLEYTMAAQGILPDPRIVEWVRRRAQPPSPDS